MRSNFRAWEPGTRSRLLLFFPSLKQNVFVDSPHYGNSLLFRSALMGLVFPVSRTKARTISSNFGANAARTENNFVFIFATIVQRS